MAGYVTVAQADAFFADEYFATRFWSPFAFTLTKDKCITSATRLLDRQAWKGTKTDPEQAFQWPRTGVSTPYGKTVDESIVPQFIKDATCYVALLFLLSLKDPLAAPINLEHSSGPAIQDSFDSGGKAEYVSVKAGTAVVEYQKSVAGKRFGQQVWDLIGYYIVAGGGAATALGGFVGGGGTKPPQEVE